jgi:hypothetical protein
MTVRKHPGESRRKRLNLVGIENSSAKSNHLFRDEPLQSVKTKALHTRVDHFIMAMKYESRATGFCGTKAQRGSGL